ncbi:phage tail tube protein, partial [Arthrospira platensis SPKY1]|nr:phage tail tube protein [Arthrospira platensis SPKY1]
MKVNSMGISMPSTGIITLDFGFTGKDMAQTGTTQYFTSPAAQSASGVMAAVNGAVIVNGQPVALITSIDFTVDRATENATAVGSNSLAEIFTGRILVTGNMSVYFTDANFRNYFNNETEV